MKYIGKSSAGVSPVRKKIQAFDRKNGSWWLWGSVNEGYAWMSVSDPNDTAHSGLFYSEQEAKDWAKKQGWSIH